MKYSWTIWFLDKIEINLYEIGEKILVKEKFPYGRPNQTGTAQA